MPRRGSLRINYHPQNCVCFLFKVHPSDGDITTSLKLLLLLFNHFFYLCDAFSQFKAAQSSISVPDIPSEQSEEKSISGVYSRDGSTNVFSRTD